MTDKTQFG